MSVHIEFLVEEYSAEMALENLLLKFLPEDVTFQIHAFQGKRDLLKKLPDRLRGYRAWIPENYRIVVLCDRDNDNCFDLKQTLEQQAILCGFTTKSNYPSDDFVVLNRIAIEELEAWFLGDADAITKAYPKILPKFATQKRYRHPDEIVGAWEALEKLLQSKNYHPGGLNKVEAARAISEEMQPDLNRSPSFQCFFSGIKSILKTDNL
ncbi:DUF4276 family protein [Geitlerinema sp. CS-897]|nr:DUF4276 family protein [Geitlerinema sp. CS-897]